MSAIPIWLVGRNVSSVTIVPQSVGSDGTLSAGTSYDLTGLVDEIDFTPRQTNENVVNMTSVRENTVPTEIDGTITLTEILQSQSSSTRNVLAEAWASGLDYAIVTVTRGGNTWAFAGVMTEYREAIAKGKSTGRMTVQLVNLGNGVNANPAYS